MRFHRSAEIFRVFRRFNDLCYDSPDYSLIQVLIKNPIWSASIERKTNFHYGNSRFFRESYCGQVPG